MDFDPTGCSCKGKVLEIVCPFCGGRGCRNGFRLVKSQVKLDEAGRVIRIVGTLRARYRCAHCRRSWTTYEPGGYPHRTFTATVEAAAVAKLAGDSGITLSSVARTFECDRRTVGRWIQQTQEVADPGDPAETCPQPEKGWDPLCLAGLLAFLDHLAHLLGAQGFHLEPGPALASLIRWQFDQFRIVAYLTRASPPLHMAVALAVG